MEEKLKMLDKYIDEISDVTGLPYWIVKIEIADEAKVGNAYELSETDVDAMLKTCEGICEAIKFIEE